MLSEEDQAEATRCYSPRLGRAWRHAQDRGLPSHRRSRQKRYRATDAEVGATAPEPQMGDHGPGETKPTGGVHVKRDPGAGMQSADMDLTLESRVDRLETALARLADA
ncbi:MAG: hypothetical protein ACREOH_05580 [Candidatus Entotheonellia bacterium]